MIWTTFFIISIIALMFSVILAVVAGKTKRGGGFFDPAKTLFIGTVVSSVSLFIPIYRETFKASGGGILETVLISIHNMIRLFVVDGEFEFITSSLQGVPTTVNRCYTVMFSALFVLAPILTFGFVLSFFKNISAYIRYITHYNFDVFVFSELNEKSLALAESVSKRGKKHLIVFTNVLEKNEDGGYELYQKAKAIGAVCFKDDINTVDFSLHDSKSSQSFFVIGEDGAENISQALEIIDKFKYRNNTNLYVFSTLIEAEILLANAFENSNYNSDDKKALIKVRRVNEVRSLINRNLYENGFEKIFSSAYQDERGVKKINALIIGMGQHGTEMTKALSWFCQMDGYEVEINSFDKDKNAKEKFLSLCPELMSFSGKTDIPGEAKYTISVHSGIDVDTNTFDGIIEGLPRTTYVFVALGNDEKNISVAVKLRTMFERMKYTPEIQAIVYNSEKKDALLDIKNFKGSPYNIDFIGDLKESYSQEVIMNSEVEEEALKRHMKWGSESDFWRYDYNYKSSVASAIHRKMKKLCKIGGIEKEPKDRTREELWNLRILEHCRWNAYMRSEGYVFGGTIEKSGRNDLAKMHNCLVPFDELPLEEQEKDDD